jgi:hypothetical protein
MSEEGLLQKSDGGKPKRPGSTSFPVGISTDNDLMGRHDSPNIGRFQGRDRSMSTSVGDGRVSKSSLSTKVLQASQEDERAPELVALEDMTLREHYKASEVLFEV